jgi:hypothetical protein
MVAAQVKSDGKIAATPWRTAGSPIKVWIQVPFHLDNGHRESG